MSIDDELLRLRLVEGPANADRSGPADSDAIKDIERKLGFGLPADYVGFLKSCGASEQVRMELNVCIGSQIRRFHDFAFFGINDVTYHRQRVVDLYSEGLVEDGALIEPKWGDFLIPFASRLPTDWFCFDYYFDAKSPPVLHLDAEGYWARQEYFDGIGYIADSFTDFLSLAALGSEDDVPHARCEPYLSESRTKWTRRVSDWLGVDLGSST